MNSPVQQAAIGLNLACNIARRALANAAKGSQDEADVTAILAVLEPLALRYPVAKPVVPQPTE